MLKSDTVSYEALSIKTGLWLIMYVLHRFCGFGDSVYKMVTVSCACSVTGWEATSETRVRVPLLLVWSTRHTHHCTEVLGTTDRTSSCSVVSSRVGLHAQRTVFVCC